VIQVFPLPDCTRFSRLKLTQDDDEIPQREDPNLADESLVAPSRNRRRIENKKRHRNVHKRKQLSSKGILSTSTCTKDS